MARYINYEGIENPVDREAVNKAIEMVCGYSVDTYEKLATVCSITVDNNNVFFFSPAGDDPRFFIEVRPNTQCVKIQQV